MTGARRHLVQRALVLGARVGIVAGFLLLWQTAAKHGVINPLYFSQPSEIWDQIHSWLSDGTLWSALAATLTVFSVGYVLGNVAGIALGAAIGSSPLLRELAEPFLAFFNALPRLILLPILIVWFGFGLTPKIIFVVLVIVIIVALNVAAGIGEVRRELIHNVRLMGATRAQVLGDVYVPSVALWVISTARLTVGYAFNAAIAAELIGATNGLGYLISQGQIQFRSSEIFAALAITVVVALVMDGLLVLAERHWMSWKATL